jgi:hypothetical protein
MNVHNSEGCTCNKITQQNDIKIMMIKNDAKLRWMQEKLYLKFKRHLLYGGGESSGINLHIKIRARCVRNFHFYNEIIFGYVLFSSIKMSFKKLY